VTHRIGEVAERAGITSSAIRFYEKEGLILKADRQGNARVYGEDIFDRLALIELAKRPVSQSPKPANWCGVYLDARRPGLACKPWRRRNSPK